MATHLSDLIGWIEDLAPPQYAEAWDSVGLQVGSPDQPVARVVVTVDVTRQVVAGVARKAGGALVAHHPVLFGPISTLRGDRWPGCVLVPLIQAGGALYVAHTNLDVAPRTNSSLALAEALGFGGATAIASGPATCEPPPGGAGAVASCEPVTVEELASRCKARLNTAAVWVAQAGTVPVERVAVVAGSGKDVWRQCAAAGATCLIAGEMGHHAALEAMATGLTVIETGHSVSERPAMAKLAAAMDETFGSDVEITLNTDTDALFAPR